MKTLAWGFGVMICLAVAAVQAQQPDAARIRAALTENQQALQKYIWQSRVQVEVDGEEKKVDLFQVRYNLAGQLERTRLGGSAQDQKEPRGPLRKRVVKGRQADAAEFAQSVKDQLHAYMSPVTFGKIVDNAFMRMDDDTVTLRAQNVRTKGDTVEVALVKATRQPMSMRIESTVDDEPVKVEVTFQKLADGPNYPARQIVDTQLGSKRLQITTENFDYSKLGG